jgi:hypothetical protein
MDNIEKVVEIRKEMMLRSLAGGLTDYQIWKIAAGIAQADSSVLLRDIARIHKEIFHLGEALDSIAQIYREDTKQKWELQKAIDNNYPMQWGNWE